jgi:phosphoglycolate phosphatase
MGIAKKYKLYVFDLDGTLADTKDDLGRAFSKVVVSHGFKEPNEEEVVAAIGRGIVNALCKLTGMNEVPERYIEEFMVAYVECCCDNVSLYAGAKELLERLKGEGAILALVTMKPKVPALKILKHLEIGIFNDVLAFEDVEKRKPDPDSLIKLMDKYSLLPGDVLMVGDSITDILYAKAAGVDICVMEYGYGNREEMLARNPEYFLGHFSEF